MGGTDNIPHGRPRHGRGAFRNLVGHRTRPGQYRAVQGKLHQSREQAEADSRGQRVCRRLLLL